MTEPAHFRELLTARWPGATLDDETDGRGRAFRATTPLGDVLAREGWDGGAFVQVWPWKALPTTVRGTTLADVLRLLPDAACAALNP